MERPNVRCPEFLPGLTWLNSTRPLTLEADLRGRVSVFDFWTYCCINCLHVVPVLRRIEQRYREEPVVVIGVHSAKFLSEKDPRNIRLAMKRYGIDHPVVVDSDHDMWERFAVHSWPTVVLVDAAGYVRDTLPGEVEEDALAVRIDALLEEGREKAILASRPLDVAPDAEADTTFLRFPGKVHVSQDRIFIADSGHNRLVIAGLDGEVRALIGDGGAGAHDGPAAQASFYDPQGMAALDGTLYVADRGNHMIRAVDLTTLDVRTMAGTGAKGRSPSHEEEAMPRHTPLRSPWAVIGMSPYLVIAMAGSHQIWAYHLAEERMGPWAGSGREDHVDGTLAEAAFAQPSGLVRGGRLIFVADSEVSSVRAIDLEDGQVRTVTGRGLFEFGDRDGPAETALLQHPLDVALDGAVLYVADSYNNKIKRIDLAAMTIETVFGDGAPGILHEPGGLAAAGGVLYIADTNNHRILKGDPRTGSLVELMVRS